MEANPPSSPRTNQILQSNLNSRVSKGTKDTIKKVTPEKIPSDQISQKAKDLAKNLKSAGASKLPKLPNLSGPTEENVSSLASEVGGHLIKDGISSLVLQSDQESKQAPGLVEEENKKNEDKDLESKKAPDLEKIQSAQTNSKPLKEGISRRPAIFFIGGLELFSSSYEGMREMAEKVPGAKYYSWDEKNQMLQDISRRHPSASVALIGHSYGADTAVKLAEELNSLENGFRRVDLLVTLDAVGTNNDIIPQNVKKTLNFFGEQNPMFNDGPKVARNIERTQVINELRPETHTQMDNSKEIQFKIVESISQLVNPSHFNE